MSIFGFGMAVFRLGCVFNLFPQYVEPKVVSKYILVTEIVILMTTIATNMSGNQMRSCILVALKYALMLLSDLTPGALNHKKYM